MEHKFSRVRIKVDASTVANSMTISDYYYSYINGGYRAKFTSMFDRTIAADSWGETGNVAFSGTSSMQESSYCVHYPAVSSVEIQSLTLSLKSGGNYVIPGLTFDFDEPLLPNTNYTLVVDIREVPYARSNIYWDGSRLWFDKTDQGNEDCQGVYFKWGSLVGISPVGGATAADVENVALYIPANISSRTWDGTKTIGTSDFGNWAGIESGGPYLYDDFSNYKGDVCKYIDGDWKIAYLRRADPLYAFPVGFEARYFGSAYGQVASGMGHMGDAGIFHNVYDTFLPVTEYRDAADGTLMGGYGIYWCDTYYGRGGLAFQGNGYINEFTPESNRGHAVRCVKADF
jgi:hypothetical protein